MAETNPTPKDYFSRQSAAYARYRPRYPSALFAYLATAAECRELAWDCATGSGQAAVPLAAHFARVVATDMSADQLRMAEPHERVEYRVARAEASGLAARSVDLVMVAQALHWFNLEAFYREVIRVLEPGGVVAVSSYGSATVVDAPELASILEHFERTTLGPYWPPGRELVGEALYTLPFPFTELKVPSFRLETEWTLELLVGYAQSWSATARYVAAQGHDPTLELEAALQPVWGPPERRRLIRWPFAVRVGRYQQ
ncbi:MAG: class I SAM-dependent methyltransferase [Gemmatimonadaceae bacterium]